eukprot:s5498_g9.t2
MVSRRLGALALFLLSALAPAFLSQAPVASRLRPLTMQAALERAPMRAWPFGPAPTSARPWLWRPLGALRDNLVFLSLALSALSFALNFRSSKPGRVLQAVKTIRKPFRPELAKDRIAERDVVDSIAKRIENWMGHATIIAGRFGSGKTVLAKDRIAERDVVDSIAKRIENWMGHATIIAGRFGSGKTVALEEALRDRRGVYVHTVRDKDWEKSLYYDLGLDNLTMLKNVLRLVRKRNQGSTPILVLDIPRTTKEGMDTVSSLAKTLSSDGSLAHVIVCASSDAMAIAFDAGGAERGYNALDLVRTCERYAKVGEEALQAKKAEMEKRAGEDVETFLRDCKFKTVDGITPAGANILKVLLQNRAGGGAAGKLAGGSGALPKDVAKWIRERGAHAVTWHIQEDKYQFASELHAKIAASFKKQIDDLSSCCEQKKVRVPASWNFGSAAHDFLSFARLLSLFVLLQVSPRFEAAAPGPRLR